MSARRARFFRNNSCCHITTRRTPEQRLFESDEDYRFYMDLLKKYKYRFRIKIYGFCLMPDYVHIVLQCEKVRHLSTFMQIINQVYAFYFNTKYKRKGRLYRERFRSILLPEEQEVLACLKEIEFSPVHLQIADSPANYPWSSCYMRIAGDAKEILDSLTLLGNVLGPEQNSVFRSKRRRIDSTVVPVLSHGQDLYQTVPRETAPIHPPV